MATTSRKNGRGFQSQDGNVTGQAETAVETVVEDGDDGWEAGSPFDDDDFDAQIGLWRTEFGVGSLLDVVARPALPALGKYELLRKLRAGRSEMAKKCKRVAGQCVLPPDIEVVTRTSLATTYDAKTRTMYVPNPVTRRALWAYLRQALMVSGHPVWHAESVARQQMRSAGIAVPRRRKWRPTTEEGAEQ